MTGESKKSKRGGARPGSGRKTDPKTLLAKASHKTTKRTEIALKALESGDSPLEIMLHYMREAWRANDRDTAVGIAKDVAPYVHPRLAATTLKGDQQNPLPMVVSWLMAPPQDDPTQS